MTVSEELKALARRFFEECVNRQNIDLMDELVSVDFVNRDAQPGTSADRAGYKQQVSQFVARFPNIHLTVEDQVAEGDKVVTRLTAHGRHVGDPAGKAPAGREAAWAAILIFRIVDGTIVERWETRDELGMMRQLDLAPNDEEAR